MGDISYFVIVICPSVCPSVRMSLCLSVRHTFVSALKHKQVVSNSYNFMKMGLHCDFWSITQTIFTRSSSIFLKMNKCQWRPSSITSNSTRHFGVIALKFSRKRLHGGFCVGVGRDLFLLQQKTTYSS